MKAPDYTYKELFIVLQRCNSFDDIRRATLAIKACIDAGSKHRGLKVCGIAVDRLNQLDKSSK
jgi:hypothetical protein